MYTDRSADQERFDPAFQIRESFFHFSFQLFRQIFVRMTDEAFLKLRKFFSEIPYDSRSHFALGANFYPYLINQKKEDGYIIQCSLYEPESFSKNLILDDVIKITPSSFNTKTVLYEKPFYN